MAADPATAYAPALLLTGCAPIVITTSLSIPLQPGDVAFAVT